MSCRHEARCFQVVPDVVQGHAELAIPYTTTLGPLCSTLPSLPRSLQPQGSRPRQGLHIHWLIPHWQCLNPLKGSLPGTRTSPRFQPPKPQALAQPPQPGLRDTPLPNALSVWLPLLGHPCIYPSSTYQLLPWLLLGRALPSLHPSPGRAHLFAGLDAGVEVPLDLPSHCSTSNHGAILGPLALFPHPTGNQAQALLLSQAPTASPHAQVLSTFTTVCLPRFSPSNLPSTPQPG